MMIHHSRFFEFFPPPQFLAMPAVGLVFSDSSVRFIELKRKGDHFVISRHGTEALPRGAIVAGKIEDRELLKKTLSEFRLKYNLSYVHFALPEQQSYLITLEVPNLKKSELRSSIELRLEEHIPLSPQETTFDYHETVCLHDEHEEDPYTVGVSALPTTIVDSYVSLFEEVGITPLSFETEAQAIARALVEKGDCKTYIFVDIGATHTGVSVVRQGIIRFTWSIVLGGDNITNALAKALTISFKDAQKKKEEQGILKNENDVDLFSIVEPTLSSLRDEISKRYDWLLSNKIGEVHEIILCGGEANVEGLESYLRSGLKVPVRLANPWINVASFDTYIPEMHLEESLRYVTAIGLALYGRIK